MKVRFEVVDDQVFLREIVAPQYVELETLPEFLLAALVYREDRRFFEHRGIDPHSYLRVAYRFVLGGGLDGASTLSQQTTRLLTLNNSRTFGRKIRESVIALKLETSLSKQQILELYLNYVPFGNGVYGIESAARYYFGKRATDLSLLEAAVLITSLPAPAVYNIQANPDLALRRAKDFLTDAASAQVIPENELEASENQRLRKGPLYLNRPEWRWIWYWIQPTINSAVSVDGSFIAYTTLDAELQVYAQLAVEQQLEKHANREAAIVCLDYSGEVRAMVGGRDYRIRMVNQATAGDRQPGSVFKPIVYLAALEYGFDPTAKLRDEPLLADWPRNTSLYAGELPFVEGLTHSPNAAAVWLMNEIGYAPIESLARKLGITSTLRNELGLALGVSEVSLNEIVGAYTAIANGGLQTVPKGLLMIVEETGSTTWCSNPRASRVANRDSVAVLQDMLHRVVTRGTARGATFSENWIAGKTGTTDGNRDGWFVGFSEHLVAGVWVGRVDRATMPDVTGSGLPLQIWRDFMSRSHRYLKLAPSDGPAVSCDGRTTQSALADARHE